MEQSKFILFVPIYRHLMTSYAISPNLISSST